jgi:hypothetical protein
MGFLIERMKGRKMLLRAKPLREPPRPASRIMKVIGETVMDPIAIEGATVAKVATVTMISAIFISVCKTGQSGYTIV